MSATILVVDDEPAIVELLALCLEAEGYKVSCASNGQQALTIARQIHPTLIITDLMMPVMDGADLINAVRNEPELRECAVVLMSSVARSRRVAESGAATLLPKPFDLDDVDRVVAEALARAG